MSVRILTGDCRAVLPTLPAESVQCVVTSPPYFGLRSYGIGRENGEIGLEPSPDEYMAEMVAVFREIRRVLKNDGVVFLNLGDSYWSSPGNGRGGGSTLAGGRPHLSGAPRGGAYGKRGTAPEGSPTRDCLCGSLCDACRAAYRLGISHSDAPRAPTPPASNSASSRVRRGSPSAHPPMWGLADPADRTEAAIPYPQPSAGHADALLPGARASTTPESAEPLLASRSAASNPAAECLSCGRSLTDCAPASAHTAACTCGIAADVSADRRTRRDASGSAYPDYTSAFLKPKDLIGIPWRVAFALQADGWWLRQDIIWSKPNPMPESVTDRCTKAHEYLFMLTKSGRYSYDADAIAEDEVYSGLTNQSPSGFKDAVRTLNGKHADKQRGHSRRHAGFNDRWDAMEKAEQCSGKRTKRSVWTVATAPFSEAHFATFPPALIEPCILAGCPEGGTVLDPFGGAGTTGLVADRLKRDAILIELNPEYAAMAENRIRGDAPMFANVTGAVA